MVAVDKSENELPGAAAAAPGPELELNRSDLLDDPIEQFRAWFAEAAAVSEMPDAMTLATVDPEGRADARMVLLKGVDRDGLRFFTHYDGIKASQLKANPDAALVFHWPELARQVRVRGPVERLSAAESDAYFASRDRSSQIGAWASQQSRPLADRAELEQSTRQTESMFAGRPVERPDDWGGYLLRPNRIEFWQGREARLHDRFVYRRSTSGWQIERLAP